MNLKKLVLLFLFNLSLQLACAQPTPIQRYAWLGGNSEGTIVALMLSHFGPSSQAPFARLVVKQADKAEPLFTETAMKMEGGEKELADLCSYLLNKNAEKLKKFGIILSNNFISEANIVVPLNQDPKIVSGWIDIENKGIEEFSVVSHKSNMCPSAPNAIRLELWLNGSKRLSENFDTCWNDGFLLRNVFRTEKALWFIIHTHTYGLNNVDSYWIEAEGIKF